MTSENGNRDELLGSLLAELDPPEHRQEFHAELRRRLADERAVARRRAAVRWGVRGFAVAAVAAILIVVIGLPGTKSGPSVASAAVVQARLRTALDTLQNLSGVLVASGPAQGAVERWQFTLDAQGDVRLDGPAAGEVETYDAATGVARSAGRSASMGGNTVFYAERTGVAPGAPDLGPPTWLLPTELAAYLRAALAAGDPAVREVTYDGRAAWELAVATVPNTVAPELSGDALRVVVDEASGLPVDVVETKNGTELRELRLENLVANRTLPADTFTLAFPAGADVSRTDEGFRRATVAAAPFAPSWLPAGYTLAQVDTAASAAAVGTGNPDSTNVVSLSYRNGLDQLVVTVRDRGTGIWSDPLASPDGFADDERPVTLTGGALAGSDARVVVDPHTLPHLWALTSDRVVTIAGELSGDELVKIAESLQAP